jgi:RNA polymerase sigma-70 factor (ECF subfamily)
VGDNCASWWAAHPGGGSRCISSEESQKRDGTLSSQDLLDADDLAQLAGGDESALGRLYDRYGALAYSVALRVVGDQTTAEDVTQEAFIRLWRHAASFEPSRGHVRAWLLRITHNLALNELRRRQARPVTVAARETTGAASPLADQCVDDDPQANPATATWLRERSSAIGRALAQVPEMQRRAIELAFFGGLTQAEVAAATGDPLGTVKSRMRLGMQRLHELLVREGVDEHSLDEG